jgi:hypothetical protein
LRETDSGVHYDATARTGDDWIQVELGQLWKILRKLGDTK